MMSSCSMREPHPLASIENLQAAKEIHQRALGVRLLIKPSVL